MRTQPNSGFREIAHTADWELEVWAPDLGRLLEQAARGMYHLTGAKVSSQPRISHLFSLHNIEPETLLIDFLNELLYLAESEGLAFDHFDLQFEGDQLKTQVIGAKIESMGKEIKAATYHNLNIIETELGLSANIVFDV